MADRPILFSGPMVRALLEGRKTQTRRVLTPQPGMLNGGLPLNNGRGSYATDAGWKRYKVGAGDRLWVREAWRAGAQDDGSPPRELNPRSVGYVADETATMLSRLGRFRHGMHMPRWASRLTLTVTEVRIQRLQDISQSDAIAEGPGFIGKITGEVCESATSHRLGIGPRWRTPRDWYADLWDGLNAARGFGWDANPWVIAVTFTVHHQNIDALGAQEAA